MLHDHAIDEEQAAAMLASAGFDIDDDDQSNVTVSLPQSDGFDVPAWAARHGVVIRRTATENGETKYVLSHCVFDANHKTPDAAIIKRANGQLAYKCFHNSCAGKGWRDARQAVEPGCYDRQQAVKSHNRPQNQPPALPDIVTASCLIDSYPKQSEVLIEGLLRRGETMNHIAAAKAGKSWNAMALALSVATGGYWLGRRVKRGRVLYIDNELRISTLAHRVKTVADAMGLQPGSYDDLSFLSLRGRLRGIDGLGELFLPLKPRQFDMAILDAVYRAMPSGSKENDNDTWRDLYNMVDHYAEHLDAAFVLVHHASKGSQADKSVTDVGAGGGAMSRATDTHLILREHAEPDCVVVDAAVRSFPPIESFCMRWSFPLWAVDDELDPVAMKRPGQRSSQEKAAQKAADHDQLVSDYESKIVTALNSIPGKAGSKSQIKTYTGNGGKAFADAFAKLLRIGRIENFTLIHPSNGREIAGFRVADNTG